MLFRACRIIALLAPFDDTVPRFFYFRVHFRYPRQAFSPGAAVVAAFTPLVVAHRPHLVGSKLHRQQNQKENNRKFSHFSLKTNQNTGILKKIRKKTTFAPCRDYEITISRYIDKIGGAEQKKSPGGPGLESGSSFWITPRLQLLRSCRSSGYEAVRVRDGCSAHRSTLCKLR